MVIGVAVGEPRVLERSDKGADPGVLCIGVALGEPRVLEKSDTGADLRVLCIEATALCVEMNLEEAEMPLEIEEAMTLIWKWSMKRKNKGLRM